MSQSWSVAQAKSKLSEVIDRAVSGEPQVITRKGKRAVIVVSVEQWEAREKRQGTLVEFLLNSPAKEHGPLEIDRFPGGLRAVDLG